MKFFRTKTATVVDRFWQLAPHERCVMLQLVRAVTRKASAVSIGTPNDDLPRHGWDEDMSDQEAQEAGESCERYLDGIAPDPAYFKSRSDEKEIRIWEKIGEEWFSASRVRYAGLPNMVLAVVGLFKDSIRAGAGDSCIELVLPDDHEDTFAHGPGKLYLDCVLWYEENGSYLIELGDVRHLPEK